MNRRTFLRMTAAAGAGGLWGCAAQRHPTACKRPNLVFVFPDQLRVQALGFMHADPTMTPNIDRFAAESRVFDNAVSNWPLCTPYRGMLMTGRWPYSTGLITNCNSAFPEVYLRDEEETFMDVLSGAGYSVGYIGKWHLDTPRNVPKADHWTTAQWETYVPKQRRHGIDFWYAYNTNGRHMDPYYWINDAAEDEKYYTKEYSPTHESKVAARFIENADGQQRDPRRPFALFVSMNPPHPPYGQMPEAYKKLYADTDPDALLNRPNVPKGHKESHKSVQDYFAQVYGVDKAFGRILEAIDQAGLRDDTIVVFSADHGEMMGGHGLMQKVVPYEESLRIPFIVRWPGRIPSGRDGLHLNVPDTMPSLLNLMGLKDRIPPQVEGTDYSAAFRGQQIQHPPTSTFYLRIGKENNARGLRSDRYTFIAEKERSKVILFDRQNDPYQRTNIAEKSPELVAKFSRELLGWLKQTNDPELGTYKDICTVQIL